MLSIKLSRKLFDEDTNLFIKPMKLFHKPINHQLVISWLNKLGWKVIIW